MFTDISKSIEACTAYYGDAEQIGKTKLISGA